MSSSSSPTAMPPVGRNPDDFIRVGRAVKIEYMKTHFDHLEIGYSLDGSHSFLTKVLYPSGVLSEFTSRFGSADPPKAGEEPSLARRVLCHIALAESLKFIATFPRTLDVSVVADGLASASLDFFTLVASRAWSQHFYENSVDNYHGPAFIGRELLGSDGLAPLPPRHAEGDMGGGVLCSNGGGKDSFLAMKLLEECGFPVHVYQHARSEYGRLDQQHRIQRRFLPHIDAVASGQARVHELSVIEDFTSGELMGLLNPDLRGDAPKGFPCQVGWPESPLEALPLVLVHGYSAYSLGNERSADTAQVPDFELEGGREVNHQWLKSFEACSALRALVRNLLVSDMEIFSLLKPLHDYRIYRLLQRYPHVLPTIHSCNIDKQSGWCKRCAKCAYVWVNLVAIFGEEAVHAVFQENLWSVPELQPYWRELLGLADRNAFECVGEVDETRLAFQACAKDAGAKGEAMELFRQRFVDAATIQASQQPQPLPDGSLPIVVDYESLRAKFNRVYDFDHGIPAWIFDKVRVNMERDE